MTPTADLVVIDTDVASRSMSGTLPLALGERLVGATPCVTFVTVGELYKGAEHARWGKSRIAGLERWLGRLPMLAADQRVARRWGEITGHALRVGRTLPANDAWFAACCLVHHASLATLNVRHFDQVAGLRLVTAE